MDNKKSLENNTEMKTMRKNKSPNKIILKSIVTFLNDLIKLGNKETIKREEKIKNGVRVNTESLPKKLILSAPIKTIIR